MMDIISIQNQLDQLYKESLDNAYAYMMDIALKAMNENNDEILLFILNELIGYYRVTTKINEGIKVADQLIHIIYAKNLEDSIAAATSYLNIATMYRAFGQLDQAMTLYQKTEDIYQQLPDDDIRVSAFYNNYSLFYMELKEYKKAIELGEKALTLVLNSQNKAEEAVSYTNLAQMYLAINQIEKAKQFVRKGIELFHNYTINDSHYFSALATLSQCYYAEEDYQKAIELYNEAIDGVERVYGKSKDYYTILNNRDQIIQLVNNKKPKGLEICQQYYETYGRKLIDEKFKKYQQYMAIGMFGFGSDCLGYDDEISQDHDFGGGFCILLPQNIYDEIGKQLQKEYDLLPDEFMNMKRMTSFHGQGRVGVFEINHFFKQFIQYFPQTLNDWLYIDENALLNCTNGMIFDDYYGQVTKIRQDLKYFPEDIRIKKIVRALAKMAQSGQYNYGRCMKRHNHVAASLAIHEFIEQTLSLIYLLNKRYKPYYKWSFYGLKDCVILYDIKDCIEQLILLPSQEEKWKDFAGSINYNDDKVRIIEYICKRVVEELNNEGLSMLKDDFLDNHTYEVMSHIKDEMIRSKHIMEG